MRRLALAALALAATAAPAAAGQADPLTPYGPWSVSTSGFAGPVSVDATCVFGPMVVGEPPQLYVHGVATAPGALSTTVRCIAQETATATLPGSAAAVSGRGFWDVPGPLCVSAEATFANGTVVAPTRCTTP